MLGTRTAVLVVALVLAASCGQVERIARDVGLVNTPMDPPAGGVEWFTQYGADPIELEDGSRWTIEVPMGAMADNDWMRANGYFDSIPDPVSVVNPDGTVAGRHARHATRSGPGVQRLLHRHTLAFHERSPRNHPRARHGVRGQANRP